jgi:tRNA modification GTPase
MFSTSDTIVAIATPAGRGGLGVIRLSGPAAARLACALVGRTLPLKPRYATFAKVAMGGRRQSTPDQVVLTYFVAPSSYTGEDVVEIAAHGSPVVLNSILRSAIDAGARLAEPGEFTFRAFLNQKLDLIQAEAVADLIESVTPLQARTAFDQLEGTLTTAIAAIDAELIDITAKLEASLDFPDEGYHFVAPKEARASIGVLIAKLDALLLQASRGRLIREGAQVAIVGSPNVGKSSLFNALLNAKRAIVTAIPGTTRDLLTERADIGGWSLSLIDTAGVRQTSDIVEKEGVSRARATIGVADLTIVLLDRSRPLSNDDRELIGITASRPRVVVWNKIDLPPSQPLEPLDPVEAIAISAATGRGLDRLIEAIGTALGSGEEQRDRPQVTNVRHAMLLERTRESLMRAAAALEAEASEEFPLLDLQEAAAALQEITGKRTADDLLRHIFERFCIGK